jgi:hypothetical protein
VRLPATFEIGPGGSLSPASVSSPAFVAIQLTLVSADRRQHRAVLETTAAHSLSVPPGGRASLLIAGLKAGRYVIQVDGAARGALLIGGEPGP